MITEENTRVGAINKQTEDGYLEMIGYGTYIGNHVPPTEDVKFMGQPLIEMNLPTPCIELDSGEYVYGCECWWGSEDKIKKIEEESKVVEYVSVDFLRGDVEL